MASTAPGVNVALQQRLYQVARLWLRGLLAVAGIAFAGIVSVLLGLNTPEGSVPLFDLIRQQPGPSLGVGVLLVAATLVAVLILRGPAPGSKPGGPGATGGKLLSRLMIATTLSTVSTSLFIALLAVVLIRPAWCPTAICPAPLVVTNPQGVHDQNMEMYFTALQSATDVLPGDPAQYTLDSAPRSIGALRTDLTASAQSPYRVVIGLHSLQRGRFGLVIERVALLVHQVPPVPQPLDVWQAGGGLNYASNVYTVTYFGEPAGTALPATYVSSPGGYVLLSPGEADDIDIQVSSRVPADLQFQVQVTYRQVNESREHTLTLPRTFEVVFADSSNWYLFDLQDGRFVPAS